MGAFQGFAGFSPSRRLLLKGGVAVGVLSALGASVVQARAGGAPRQGLLVLSSVQARTLLAFAEATLEVSGFPPVSSTSLMSRIDQELFFVEEPLRDDFLLAVDAARYLPLAYGRFSMLEKLSPDERREFLEGLADTRIDTVRAIVNALSLVTRLVYFADRSVWPVLGYEGTHAGLPPFETEQNRFYGETLEKHDGGKL